jgi:hypothetical protein
VIVHVWHDQYGYNIQNVFKFFFRILAHNKPPVRFTFAEVVKHSLSLEQNTQAWCNSCERYQPHVGLQISNTNMYNHIIKFNLILIVLFIYPEVTSECCRKEEVIRERRRKHVHQKQMLSTISLDIEQQKNEFDRISKVRFSPIYS